MQKFNELDKKLQSGSQFAMRSTVKDIYILYLNGSKVACFSDEFGCKAQINSIKLQIEDIMEGVIKHLPQPERTQLRNTIRANLNNMNFTCRKVANPNYKKSGFSDKDGFDAKDFQGLTAFSQGFEESIFSSTKEKEKNDSLESLILSSDKQKNGGQKTFADLFSVNTSAGNPLEIINKNDLKVDELTDYVNKFFTNQDGKYDAQLCDLVDKTFTDKMGYSLNQIAFKNQTPEEMQKAVDYYNRLGGKYADVANELYDDNMKRWKENLHTPGWEDICNSIDNPQKFVSILNEAGIRNNNQIPLPIASDEANYYMYLENKNEMLTVAKNGNNIIISPLEGTSLNTLLNSDKLKFTEEGTLSRNIKESAQMLYSENSVQYNLNQDGSFSNYSFLSNAKGKIGTKNLVKVDLIDITHAVAPKLALKEDKETFYFQTSKTGVSVSAEIYGQINLKYKGIEGFWGYDINNGNSEIGMNSPLKTIVNIGPDRALTGGTVGINTEYGRSSIEINGNETEVSVGISVPYNGVNAGMDVTYQKTSEYSRRTVKPSLTVKVGKTLNVGGGIEFGLTNFKQSDMNYMLNVLPVEVSEKIYDAFLSNQDLQERNIYKKVPVRDEFTTVYETRIEDTISDEAFESAKNKFKKEMDEKRAVYNQIVPELKKNNRVFNPCMVTVTSESNLSPGLFIK
jgi:hypothetical protein